VEETIEKEHSSAGRDGMESEIRGKTKAQAVQDLKFDLEQEEYLNVIQDSAARRLMTALRGGTNMLAVEKDRWKHKDLKKRTCSVCANGSTEDELHFLLECTAYERERRARDQRIRTATDFDFRKMEGETDWLAQMMLGVGCPNTSKRQFIQRETAKFVELAMQKRNLILYSNSD